MARGGMHISVRHLLMQICVFETNLASTVYAMALCRNCGDTPARTRRSCCPLMQSESDTRVRHKQLGTKCMSCTPMQQATVTCDKHLGTKCISCTPMQLATDAPIYFAACTPVVAQDNLRMLAHKKAAVDPRMQASNPCAHILKRTWDVRMYYKPATAKYGQKGNSRRSNA